MLLVYVAVTLWLWCGTALGDELRNVPLVPAPRQNITERKVWVLELKINFVRPFPSVVERPAGSDLKMKCEAVLNFTKVYRSKERGVDRLGGEELTLKDVPRQHLTALSGNVKMFWMRRNATILNGSRVTIRSSSNDSSSTVATMLRIRDLRHDDEDTYTCVIKNENYENKSMFKLEVTGSGTDDREVELPTYKPLYSESGDTGESSATAAGHSHRLTSPTITAAPKPTTTSPKKVTPSICQKYVGKQCAVHLKGHYVYIPHTTTQEFLEHKLAKAFQVTQYSNDISTNCEDYAIPSLCYSTFPICRNPYLTNEMFLRETNDLILPVPNELSKTDGRSANTEDGEETKIHFENLPANGLPRELDPSLKGSSTSDGSTLASPDLLNATLNRFNYRYNSTILRRVCKQDCEILENELCQKEYAIAKRHPHIGQELTLEDCQDLPENDPDCLKIGIPEVMVSEDDCYWENGVGYRGEVDVSSGGAACIVWSKQLFVKPSEYLELAGRHSYCRNPGGKESQPWCFIEREEKHVKQLCDIPKCAHKIWIYIIIVFLALITFFATTLLCVCCRNRNKQGATTIRDINVPNADKNIYGNSRLNSPMELSDVMLGHMLAQNHSSRARGNGMLRVPQYSLSQIKFLEELGEGAFGKVYKGLLSQGSDTRFVAVKALKENASAKTKADFRREIELISELRHENIVCIVGVALREEPLCMLFEFMARGDLHEFLMGRAPPSNKGLPPVRLLNIACHIAAGMQYLAAHHYVHRDLAARNCLVGNDYVVKISDFGLSRDIYSSDYYRVQSKSLLPVRWMPPESILYGKFTTESDIWSYGVVLWEIYSYGLQPYYGFSNQEVIAMVRGGELLACPAGCPTPIYSLMRDCWNHTPQRRPHFEDITNRFYAWIQMGGCREGGSSESSATGSGDARERVPLLPAHCSSSNGSLASAGRRKLSVASRLPDDSCSTCSEVPPQVSKFKKGSCGSLIEGDRTGARDTIVRIHTTSQGNDI